MADRTDGSITLRSPRPEDRAALLTIDDPEIARYLGSPGPDDPDPVFWIAADDEIVGWIDFDRDHRAWLDHSKVNIGYAIHPAHRGKGYATRAVRLLLQHLGDATDVATATLLIDPSNGPSLALAARAGFVETGVVDGERLFELAVER